MVQRQRIADGEGEGDGGEMTLRKKGGRGFASKARNCDVSFTPGFSPVSNEDKWRWQISAVLLYACGSLLTDL